jgi:hypothetical protein
MNKNILTILVIILLQSCSSDADSNDKIIGKWVLIEQYESGVQVDLDCSQYFYVEFKANKEMVSDYLDFDSTPQACTGFDFTINTWRKNGNKYETYLRPNDIHSEIFFDGDYLILDLADLPKRYIYVSLN